MHLRQRSTNKWVLQLMVKREKFHYRKLQHMHNIHRHTYVHWTYSERARAPHSLIRTPSNERWSSEVVKESVCLWGKEKVNACLRMNGWASEREIFRVCYLQYLINVFAMTCTEKRERARSSYFICVIANLMLKALLTGWLVGCMTDWFSWKRA